MKENLKKFLEAVSQNEELAKKINTLSMEDILALAKEMGIALTEEDLTTPQTLDDADLETVAGGKECFCAMGGGGTADSPIEKTCACVTVGVGEWNEKFDDRLTGNRCLCILGGSGNA